MRKFLFILTMICVLNDTVFSNEYFFFNQTLTSGGSTMYPSPKAYSILTIPPRHGLVLLQFTVSGHADCTYFYDDQILISPGPFTFFDGSYVMEPNTTLNIIQKPRYTDNGNRPSESFVTVTGYYISDCPISDLNGDCQVNFMDLAILASEWLSGY